MMRPEPHIYGESILLAVSGGVDSIVMAEMLSHNNLRKVRLAVAHCNFHLRGEESDEDVAFVRRWADDKGLECFVKDFDTGTFARENGVSIEMAARELRYRWFDELCNEKGFDGVALAHNANDNAETLILNLLRGTGLKGICAMAETGTNPYGNTRIFRPMLRFTRREIEDYARHHGISWRTDSTNLQSEYRRNRIRNVVFPLFSKINPSFIETFASNIANFREAAGIVDDYVSQSGMKTFSSAGDRIRIDELVSLPHWEYLLFSSLNGAGFSAAVIADLTRLLKGDGVVAGRCFHASDLILVTTAEELLLKDKTREETAEWEVELLDWDSTMSPRMERGVVVMDASAFDGKPLLRRWKNGDWLNPIGLKGRKKISDLLTDLKYDIMAKQTVMVVEGVGSHVLAVVGERIDESVKVTTETARVWRIARK